MPLGNCSRRTNAKCEIQAAVSGSNNALHTESRQQIARDARLD